MRHGKKFNHLGRTAPHRKAMLSNMASSLILNKRITTTVAKAKALRKFVEPLITKAKSDNTHSRRVVFSYLQDKESVTELFGGVADKVANRPGGYTRIFKTGNRLGDNADMCIMELVDYNELLLKDAAPEKAKTRRSRRGKGGAKAEAAPAAIESESAVVEDATVVEETVEAVTEETAAPVEEAATEEVVEESAAPVEEAATEEVVEEAVTEEPVEAVVEETAEATEEVEAAAEESTEEVSDEGTQEEASDESDDKEKE
ncbi:MAG: 50S ribosomal protein L17 [Cyclobacteriaceae bacterium]